jgi:hypothetical protein
MATLTQLADGFDIAAALMALATAGLFTAIALLASSIAEWFERDS